MTVAAPTSRLAARPNLDVRANHGVIGKGFQNTGEH